VTFLLMQSTVLAQAVTETRRGVDLVLPDLREMIAGIIAFAIVFGFVWFKGRHWIDRTLTARQQAIAGRLEEAEQTKVQADALLVDYQRQVAGARDEGNRIVEDARRSAEAVRAEITARARAEADGIARRNREAIVAERERATGEVRDLVADLSLELAQKVVAGSVDAGAQAVLVDRYIDDLDGMPH
jgi:F-type H+-transporting ATPase subunit b